MRARAQQAERFDSWRREQLKDSDFRKAYRQERNAIFLAYKVAKLGSELGWSQAELARRIGSSARAVARLEGGDFEGFTVDRLEKLAEAMGMELVLDLKTVPLIRAHSRLQPPETAHRLRPAPGS